MPSVTIDGATGKIVWDFDQTVTLRGIRATPATARRLARELLRLADQLDPPHGLDGNGRRPGWPLFPEKE